MYWFCDRNLPYLNFYVDFNDKGNFEIKPIFLLLHVSRNRQNRPETKKIIFQIYSYLSYICDIQIVVLNQKYYIDQIEITERINNIFLSKKERTLLNPRTVFLNKPSQSSTNNTNDSDDEEVVVMMSDDFQKEKQEISTGLNKKSSLDALKSSPIQVSQKILERKCKTIFLINDNTVYHYDEQFDIDLCQNHFFKENPIWIPLH